MVAAQRLDELPLPFLIVSVVLLDDVLADVMRRDAASGGIRLLGIDGPSGSGKSTLASQLVARSGAPLIQIDDFVSWRDFAGWWPRFEQQALTPLLSGSAAHYQVRDWTNDEFGTSLNGWRTVAWAPMVVLEGVTQTEEQFFADDGTRARARADLRVNGRPDTPHDQATEVVVLDP